MNLNQLIIDTLSPLNISVTPLKHDGEDKNYIVFQEYLGQGDSYSDDEEDATRHYIQMNLFTIGNNIALVKSIKGLLKSVEIKRTGEYDAWDDAVLRYNHTFRFEYLESI